jgi:hypothetical protein
MMHTLPLQNLSATSAGKPRSTADPEHVAWPLPEAAQAWPATSQVCRAVSGAAPSAKPAPPLGAGTVGKATGDAAGAVGAALRCAAVVSSRSWQETLLSLTATRVALVPFETIAGFAVSSWVQ